jgi:pimeloyl-ACP methyl ester carboxylesterase
MPDGEHGIDREAPKQDMDREAPKQDVDREAPKHGDGLASVAGGARPDDARVSVADGVRLHIRRWMPVHRDPTSAVANLPPPAVPSREFILVHGLSSNARLWDAVAARLADAGHSATAVDLRSHGESDAPEDGYDTATAADDVARAAESLGIKSAVVVGQSWGGNVVVRLAAKHPEVVAALALVDGGWLSPSSEFDSWEAAERTLRPPEIDGRSAAQMRAMLRASHPQWSDDAIDATAANLAVMPDGTIRRRLSIPHHMQIVRSMWNDPPTPDYSAIRVPVLLMPALPADPGTAAGRRARVARAAALLADASISEYIGGDHDLHAQQPERVAGDVLALAARLDNVDALAGPRDGEWPDR